MALSANENGSNNGVMDSGGNDVLSDLRNTMTVGYIHEAYKEWCIKNADYVSGQTRRNKPLYPCQALA